MKASSTSDRFMVLVLRLPSYNPCSHQRERILVAKKPLTHAATTIEFVSISVARPSECISLRRILIVAADLLILVLAHFCEDDALHADMIK